MKRFVRCLAASLLFGTVVTLGACELKGQTISEGCERMGDRCRISDRVLGVCSEDPTASCEQPPCLRCQDQH